jgi:predicted DNA-binding transcriptional regulator YafY
MRGQFRIIRHPAPSNIDPAVHERILTAIHERRLLRFTYLDKVRIVEPHDYGIQKGTVNLFAYQIAGESSSSRLPDWRKFAVPRISRLELLEEFFPGSRSVPSQRHQEWDVLFARVDHS